MTPLTPQNQRETTLQASEITQLNSTMDNQNWIVRNIIQIMKNDEMCPAKTSSWIQIHRTVEWLVSWQAAHVSKKTKIINDLLTQSLFIDQPFIYDSYHVINYLLAFLSRNQKIAGDQVTPQPTSRINPDGTQNHMGNHSGHSLWPHVWCSQFFMVLVTWCYKSHHHTSSHFWIGSLTNGFITNYDTGMIQNGIPM